MQQLNNSSLQVESITIVSQNAKDRHKLSCLVYNDPATKLCVVQSNAHKMQQLYLLYGKPFDLSLAPATHSQDFGPSRNR